MKCDMIKNGLKLNVLKGWLFMDSINNVNALGNTNNISHNKAQQPEVKNECAINDTFVHSNNAEVRGGPGVYHPPHHHPPHHGPVHPPHHGPSHPGHGHH